MSDSHQASRTAARARFGQLVAFFDAVRATEVHEEFTAALAETTATAPPGTAVELGCGTGALLELWVRTGRPALGLDVVPAMVATARERTGCPGVVADVARLPFADGCLSAVAGALYLQLVGDQDGAIREAFRVLRPGGIHAVVVPSVTWDSDRARELSALRGSGSVENEFLLGCAGAAVASRRYAAEPFQSVLFEAGFRDLRCRPLLNGYVLEFSGRRPARDPALIGWPPGARIRARPRQLDRGSASSPASDEEMER